VNDCLKEIYSFEEFLVENISSEVFSADDYITLGNLVSSQSIEKNRFASLLCT